MKRISLFFIFITFLCFLTGCDQDTPVVPPTPTTGELYVIVSSNGTGVTRLDVHDSEDDETVWSSECELNQETLITLPPGTYRVVATFGGKTKESTVTVAAGQASRLSFEFIQQRELNVRVGLSAGSTSGEATVFVNGVGYPVTIGQSETLSVLLADSYKLEAVYTDTKTGKTYSSEVEISNADVPSIVEMTIKIEDESVVERPVLRLLVQSDDLQDGHVISGVIDGRNYQFYINEWTTITDLEAGSYTVTIEQIVEGFTYSGTGTFTLTAGKTEDVTVNLRSNKSDGGFDIDDEIVGNVEIEVEGVSASYRTPSTLSASATWTYDEELKPVWRLRAVDGAYETIGTEAILSFPFSEKAEGVYVLSFDLMKGDDVAARQVWRINVFN